MPPESEEGIGSYLGRSWTRFGIPIDQEVSRSHSTLGNERGMLKPSLRGLTTEEGLNANRLEIR